MELKYGKSLSLNADLDLSGLPYINETFIYGQVNELKADKRERSRLYRCQVITSKTGNYPKVLCIRY
jgi:hypothetical protein